MERNGRPSPYLCARRPAGRPWGEAVRVFFGISKHLYRDEIVEGAYDESDDKDTASKKATRRIRIFTLAIATRRRSSVPRCLALAG